MSFLAEPAPTPDVTRMYDQDVSDNGYVMNLTRLWAQDPVAHEAFQAAVQRVSASLSVRERGILVSATAATLGDSYCSLAWGTRLAATGSGEQAVAVLTGQDGDLSPREHALAQWARAVTAAPSATTAAQVDTLRQAGWDDGQIFALTAYIALRIAFSTINGALGAAPDQALVAAAPAAVLEAVTWGRPPG